MSGHSKWSTIKRRKGAQDAKRSNEFAKLLRAVEVAAREIVPGDLLLLEAGDRASADARVEEVFSLQVEEAALTGESLPVEKQAEALPGDELPVGDRRNMLYAGTTVTYGRGRAVAVAS